MYCKNCGGPLTPSDERIVTDDLYYRGGARCGACNYLYFPDFPTTWNAEPWVADFERKAEMILHQIPNCEDDWRRDLYLVLHFQACLKSGVTWYFTSPEFGERQRLSSVLSSLGALQSVQTLERIEALSQRPEQVLEEYGLVGDSSERFDDAWEEVTEELSDSLDPNLNRLIYERLMRDRPV